MIWTVLMVYLNNLIFLITYQGEEVKIGFKVHQLNFNRCIMLVVLCCMGTSMSLHFKRSSYWSVDQVNNTWILLFDGVGLLHALPTLNLVFLFNQHWRNWKRQLYQKQPGSAKSISSLQEQIKENKKSTWRNSLFHKQEVFL